jgi:hypothetical protein
VPEIWKFFRFLTRKKISANFSQWGLEHRCNVSDKVFQYAQDHILTWITKSKFAVQLEKSAKKEIERRAQAKN